MTATALLLVAAAVGAAGTSSSCPAGTVPCHALGLAASGWACCSDTTTPAAPVPPPPGPLALTIDWTAETRRSVTAATVEVDAMPTLARQPATDPYVASHYGGSFDKYYSALSDLNASFVRFAPWCPNPRLVVPELTPPSCTATQPASNWNSTFFDQLMKDFMTAVCGPGAARGQCSKHHSVIQQLSTMPSWMYVGGMELGEVPTNPYVPTRGGHKEYEQGGALVDTSCETMARHIGRIVGWYTLGGFQDECGHWHHSGLKYKWYGLSILNEDEHGIKPEGGVAYTTCYDAVRRQLLKINSSIIPVGPEISGGCSFPSGQFDYLAHYLNKSNHVDEYEPLIGSFHVGINGDGMTDQNAESFFPSWDHALAGFVPALDKLLTELRSPAKLILNEFVNFVGDWCESPGPPGSRASCPDWQSNATAGGDPDLTHGKGVKINRRTWAWNAAAGVFAYAFGTLAEHGYLLVGQDQLVAGTWPDNEPAVAMLDWVTGDRNAKYYVTQLLASTVGAAVEKSLYPYAVSPNNVTGGAAALLYALPFKYTAVGGARGVLLVNKKAEALNITIAGFGGATATVVEVNTHSRGHQPPPDGGAGFQPPLQRPLSSSGELELGPFAVAVVQQKAE